MSLLSESKNKSYQVPVLILGGGASGVVMTAELLRRGIAVRTIDKLPQPHNYSKSLLVHARTLEMIERLDENVLKKFFTYGRKINGTSFSFKGIDTKPAFDFRGLKTTKYAHALISRQDNTERFIREYIKDEFNYDIEWGVEACEIGQDKDGVTVKVKHRNDNDREEIIHARYLIGSDGTHSRARQSLGVDYEGEDYEGMKLQNMDAPLTNLPKECDEWLNFFIAENRSLLVAPLPEGNYRLLLSDMGEAARPGITPHEAFKEFVDEHLNEVEIGKALWTSVWEIRKRLATSYRRGNIFLVGDSAHVHSPAGGQGMNCCMQDAHNLAWKLALTLQGHAKESLLDTFEEERLPIGEQVLEGASSIHQIMNGHGENLGKRFEKANNADWLKATIGRLSGISYTYREQVTTPTGLTQLNTPLAGDRAPDADLGEGKSLYTHLCHPGITLIGYVPERTRDIDSINKIFTQVQEKFKTAFRCLTLDGDYNAKFKETYGLGGEAVLFVIRPDAYIGFVCLLSESDYLIEYLDSFLL